MDEKKICIKCGEEKYKYDFYCSGHEYICEECWTVRNLRELR